MKSEKGQGAVEIIIALFVIIVLVLFLDTIMALVNDGQGLFDVLFAPLDTFKNIIPTK